MEYREWKFVEKSKWPRGQWDREPDKAQWTDEVTGLPCLMHRNDGGALCGYVGVPEGHPSFGKAYDDVDTDVHGGLNFASLCGELDEQNGHGICHVPAEGEPEKVWWFGFDCAHFQDLCPGYDADGGGLYRNFSFVKRECASLAQQLADYGKP